MKRFFPASLVFLTLALPAAPAASPLVLTNVRFWTGADHTRVVADLSGKARFTHRFLSHPFRIAVDIRQTRFRGTTRKIGVGDGLVEAIRMNALRSGVAQIVLDLASPARYQVFALPPVSGRPDRVVIDVFRDVGSEAPARGSDDGARRVVIDPGHGGDDPGATGYFGLREKDLTLDLARRLAAELNGRPGFEALLTREGDAFIKLKDRQLFARKQRADIFVSLHANSARSRRPNGFEIFFLSLRGATDKMARELAHKENAADLVGGVPPSAEDDVLSILFDYLQEEGMKKSEVLAEEIYGAFRGGSDMELRNVKQAGFAVLKSLEIPAVLVEVGFLTNRGDAALLREGAFRQTIAANLARGIEEYFARASEESVLFHVVRKGETAWSIARMYGVGVRDLLAGNNLEPTAALEVGQRLRIP